MGSFFAQVVKDVQGLLPQPLPVAPGGRPSLHSGPISCGEVMHMVHDLLMHQAQEIRRRTAHFPFALLPVSNVVIVERRSRILLLPWLFSTPC